jgi:hypothetical protein
MIGRDELFERNTRRMAHPKSAGALAPKQLTMQHKGVPRRKRNAPLTPSPTWTCPYCGHVHTPATIMRIGWDTLECQLCRQEFPSLPDEMKGSA